MERSEKKFDMFEESQKTLVQSSEIVSALLPRGPVEVAKTYLRRTISEKSRSIYTRLRFR